MDLNMSYRVPFKPDIQDHTQSLSVIPMALTQEAIDEYKKNREDLNNVTTRRLTSIWMCKMLSIAGNWRPSISSTLHCYDYINQLVCDIKNDNISTDYCIPNEYCDYFLTTDPDIIKKIIHNELMYYSELCAVRHDN